MFLNNKKLVVIMLFLLFPAILSATSDGLSNIEKDFLKAAKRGDILVLQDCVDQGVDIDVMADEADDRYEEKTALMLSAEYCRIDFVKFLLAKDVDPNKMTRDKWWSALILAAKFNCIEGIEILLDNGADIKQAGVGGDALTWAVKKLKSCEDDNKSIVRQAKDKGIFIDYAPSYKTDVIAPDDCIRPSYYDFFYKPIKPIYLGTLDWLWFADDQIKNSTQVVTKQESTRDLLMQVMDDCERCKKDYNDMYDKVAAKGYMINSHFTLEGRIPIIEEGFLFGVEFGIDWKFFGLNNDVSYCFENEKNEWLEGEMANIVNNSQCLETESGLEL